MRGTRRGTRRCTSPSTTTVPRPRASCSSTARARAPAPAPAPAADPNDATAAAFEAALLRLETAAALPPVAAIGVGGLPDASQLAAIERAIERLEQRATALEPPKRKSVLESHGSGLSRLGRSLTNLFATPDAEKLEQVVARLEKIGGIEGSGEKVGASGTPTPAQLAELEAMLEPLEAVAPH